jgi:micrococcal nuclease
MLQTRKSSLTLVLTLIITMSMSFLGQASAQDINLRDELRLTMAKARVTQIVDGVTIIVNNTTTLNIPMLYIPWETPREPGAGMLRAKEYLDKELKDRFVRVYQVRNQNRGQTNAMGHVQAYIERDDGLWIQRDMVEKGLAFVYPSQSHYDYADALFKAEEKARVDKAGFWADEKWNVMTDEEAKSLDNRFAIVEGTIEKIVTRNNTIYLNFERDWKTDFTISIDSAKRRDFARAGANPMQWQGKKVRVRGWLQQYNGPYIEIFHPSQIELIKDTPDEDT